MPHIRILTTPALPKQDPLPFDPPLACDRPAMWIEWWPAQGGPVVRAARRATLRGQWALAYSVSGAHKLVLGFRTTWRAIVSLAANEAKWHGLTECLHCKTWHIAARCFGCGADVRADACDECGGLLCQRCCTAAERAATATMEVGA